MSPITYDPWEHVNTTAGPLAKENISVMEALSTTNVMVQYLKHGQERNGGSEIVHLYGRRGRPRTSTNWEIIRSPPGTPPSIPSRRTSGRRSSRTVHWSSWTGRSIHPSSNFGFGGRRLARSNVGQQFTMVSADRTVKNVTVIGFMKQSNLNGVFMSASSFNDTYHPTGYSLFLVTFASGTGCGPPGGTVQAGVRGVRRSDHRHQDPGKADNQHHRQLHDAVPGVPQHGPGHRGLRSRHHYHPFHTREAAGDRHDAGDGLHQTHGRDELRDRIGVHLGARDRASDQGLGSSSGTISGICS